ncbi:plasmid transfer protein TraA [Kitasatospora sp. NPDC001309]|uniref:plasmid transfer protein TraA n=1 Tax=Kitasatospora sp. NPDC001309 TaxID=3364013 RepID=UPI0036CF2A36
MATTSHNGATTSTSTGGKTTGGGSHNSYKTGGGFAPSGAFAPSFAPSFGISVNVNKGMPGGAGFSPTGGQQGNGGQMLLPAPEFDSTDQVRAYCNHVRALMIQIGLELGMASKLLEARLRQVQRRPGAMPGDGWVRARSVAGHLRKSGDAAVAVAKQATATVGALEREFRPAAPVRSATPFRI